MGKILVLGAGMVGRAIAIDLGLSGHEVILVDKNMNALSEVDRLYSERTKTQLKMSCFDLSVKLDLQNVIKLYHPDIVVSAVPGFMGFKTLETVIETGTNIVDISFFPEDALSLTELAKTNKVTAIVDCGVAPGLDNIILGKINNEMIVTDFECLVGGLPKEKKWPFNYKAPFSPVDVIEEYTRPARYVENNRTIIKEALSDCELVEFDKIGTLESFNSDGLRSLIWTMPHINNMKEKTLRYPGHVDYVKALKYSGFFSKDIIFGNKSILDFTSAILFKEWKLKPEDEELTVMRITIKGMVFDKYESKTIVFDLHDEYDKDTKTSSMARTTGYTATAATNMVLEGLFVRTGVFPPELIGSDNNCYSYIMTHLKNRNIEFKIS